MEKQKEIEIVALMIKMYCHHYHKPGDGLCEECQELLDYVEFRRSKCPFGDNKPFCSNCKIHCYKPVMREKIRKVMKFSGPRIFFYHPVVATRHVIQSVEHKRELKKQKKLAEKNGTANVANEKVAKKVDTKAVETKNANVENKDVIKATENVVTNDVNVTTEVFNEVDNKNAEQIDVGTASVKEDKE